MQHLWIAWIVGAAAATIPDGRGGGDPVPEEEREENAKRIPCPFLAGLYSEGILKPDEYGRVNSQHLKEAMVAAGSTVPNAIFPAFGTVRFAEEDIHQTERHWDYGLVPSGFLDQLGLEKDLSNLWLNIMTMNVPDKCVDAAGHAQVPSKFPCNANPQHVQHGYSTTIRDPRYDAQDPTREKRFKDWIEPTLVVNKSLSDEKVMTFTGFAALLARMAAEGDLSGEWSLERNLTFFGSNLHHYHPHVEQYPNAYALYHWTAWLAWVGLWEAYGYPDGSGGKFMIESDLRRFMLEGKLPKNWKPATFTLKDVGYTMIALEGHDIPWGDLYARALKKQFPLSKFLPVRAKYIVYVSLCRPFGSLFSRYLSFTPEPEAIETEWRYMANYAATQRSLGFFKDNIVNPMPNVNSAVVV